MMATLNHEKRRQKRWVKRLSIEFASDGQNYRGICRNLSSDGLFIKTRKPLAPGNIINMIVHLPDGSTSKLTGRVTRAIRDPYSLIFETAGIPSKDGMGIQLLEKDANYLKFIGSFLSVPESSLRRCRGEG
jgi:hypothetical protein